MNKEGGPVIPMGRGKEIGIEKLMEEIREITQQWDTLINDLLKAQTLREELVEIERGKPPEQQNYEFIEKLEKEIKTLEELEDDATEKHLNALNKQDELRDQWVIETERTEIAEIKREIAEIEKRIHEL